MKRGVAPLAIALSLGVALPAAQVSNLRQSRAADFLSQTLKPLTEYSASRHLEASTAMFSASIEVLTTLRNRTFTHTVVSEKGNGYIRSSILGEFLRREKEKVEKGQDIDSFTLNNYTIDSVETGEGGLLKVLAKPKSKDNPFEECFLFMNPKGEVVSSIGKVKKPNFMLNNVVARTTFNQINGVRMPVYLESTAQVLLFGQSRFEMKYRYTSVNWMAVKHK